MVLIFDVSFNLVIESWDAGRVRFLTDDPDNVAWGAGPTWLPHLVNTIEGLLVVVVTVAFIAKAGKLPVLWYGDKGEKVSSHPLQVVSPGASPDQVQQAKEEASHYLVTPGGTLMFQHDTDDDDDDDEGEEKGGDGNGAEHNKKRRQAPLPTTLKLAIMILVLTAMAGLWFDSYAAYEGLQVARNWLGSMSYLCHSVTALICFRLFDVSGSVTQRLAKVGWVRG